MASARSRSSRDPDAGSAPRELRTDRLLLRGWRAADAAPFGAINADPEVMRYIGSGALTRTSSEDMRARLEDEWTRTGRGLWAVERREDGRLLGFCGLTRPAWGGPRLAGEVEVGWRLGRDAWGHGYATEAARAALSAAWGPLGLERVISIIHPDNARSLAVAERLGMRVTGRTVHPPTRWPVLLLAATRPADGANPATAEGTGAGPDAPPRAEEA